MREIRLIQDGGQWQWEVVQYADSGLAFTVADDGPYDTAEDALTDAQDAYNAPENDQ